MLSLVLSLLHLFWFNFVLVLLVPKATGLTFTAAHMLVRARIDDPGSPATDRHMGPRSNVSSVLCGSLWPCNHRSIIAAGPACLHRFAHAAIMVLHFRDHKAVTRLINIKVDTLNFFAPIVSTFMFFISENLIWTEQVPFFPCTRHNK